MRPELKADTPVPTVDVPGNTVILVPGASWDEALIVEAPAKYQVVIRARRRINYLQVVMRCFGHFVPSE